MMRDLIRATAAGAALVLLTLLGPAPVSAQEQEGSESEEDQAPVPGALTPIGEDGEELEVEEPEPEPLIFRNSFFSWQTGVTANTFAPGAQLTYNPTAVMYFNLTPRLYLAPTTFLWANQSLTLELTDGDDGTYNREPLLSDTLIDVRHLIMWEGFVFQLQGRIGLPVSKASQAAQRVLQTGVGLTVVRPIPEAANLTIAATFSYRRWWGMSNVPLVQDPYPCAAPPGEAPMCDQAGTISAASDVILTGLNFNMVPVGAFSLSFSAFYFATQGYDLATYRRQFEAGGASVELEDQSPTHWRSFTYFALQAAYDVLPYLNLAIGVQNSGFAAPLYNPNGSVRSPFNPDTQIYLTATLGIDGLYQQLQGADGGLTPEERQRRRQGLARNSEQGGDQRDEQASGAVIF